MSEEPIHILLIEDEPAHAELVQRAFEARHAPARLEIANTLTAARAYLLDGTVPLQLIIADWRLPDGESIELLTTNAVHLTIPVIIMTSHGNERVAVEALKAGALDYVVKSEATLLDMPHIAEHALREWQIRNERARMAAALRDSEEYLRLALHAARLGIWNWDMQADRVTWSEAVASMFGLRLDQLGGTYEAYLNLIHKGDVDSVVHTIGTSLVGKNQKYRIEHRVIWPDGSEHWIEGLGQVYHDERGKPIRMTGTVADITDRKEAEQKLRLYVERLTTLHEIDLAILSAQSIEAIARAALIRIQRLVPNRRSDVVLFNSEVAEAVVVAASVDGKIRHIGQRLPLADFEIQEALRAGWVYVVNDLTGLTAPSTVEQQMLARGARAYIDVPLVVDGKLIGVLGMETIEANTFGDELIEIVREVAVQVAIAIRQSRLFDQIKHHAAELEQRVAERTRELSAANERLTELDRLKSKFVSDVSHELRTPIANLKLYAGLLERGKPEKLSQYIAVLKQQASRLAQLVEDILSLSRLEMGKERIAFGPVDLNHVVDEVVTAHQPRAEANNLALTVTLGDDVRLVCGEINQLSQVVTNLVVNALNYTRQGCVRVTTYQLGDQACLQVEDTGLGIDAADLPHIFDRFYRGKRPKQGDIPGTGLGLAIVKEIVDLHQGRVEVKSAIGLGTMFQVWLPMMKAGG